MFHLILSNNEVTGARRRPQLRTTDFAVRSVIWLKEPWSWFGSSPKLTLSRERAFNIS